jgi:hypothetical protein
MLLALASSPRGARYAPPAFSLRQSAGHILSYRDCDPFLSKYPPWMARSNVALLFGLLAVGALAAGVYVHVTAEPEETRRIRREADRLLRARAVRIADTHWNSTLREKARRGVEFADREWFGKNRSGDRPPQGLPSQIHGNWCGSGGRGPILDDVDQLCFEHDQAYQRADEVARLWRQGRRPLLA